MTDTASPPATPPGGVASPPNTASPFRKAASTPKRPKIFVHGESGDGKTTLALGFPKPVVLDLESGTDLYGDAFDFDVLKASSPDEVMSAIDWLRANPTSYSTFVFDPVTLYWDWLQRKWSEIFLKRNKQSKGYRFEFYDFQPRDWMTIKSELKDLLRKIVALDMNVVVTARSKTQYADGAFMQAVGKTFDCERSLPYVFDVVLRLYRDDKGRYLALVEKDRTQKLPKIPFEWSYDVFANAFGADVLTRAAALPTPPSDAQRKRIRELINALGIPQNQVNTVCEEYGAAGVHELSADSMAQIIERLDVALAKKTSSQKES